MKVRGCHTLGPMISPSYPLSLPDLPPHTRTGVLDLLHIPAFLEVLAQAASRERKRNRSGGLASVRVSWSCPVSAGEQHSPAAESELCYSLGWVPGVEGNGQGEAGFIVVSTKETLTVSRVIDQVVPGGKK